MCRLLLNEWLGDFISLFYPRVCFACNNALLKHEEYLCTECLYNLPKTNFHLYKDNPVANQFIGKINFNAAASFYYFSKGGKVQHLIHQFKYKGYRNLGLFIGEIYGTQLIKSELFSDIDIIIPIPLHPRKQLQRGYNQAEWFAKGLSLSIKADVDTVTLKRIHASESQTHKTRFNRWENVQEIFTLSNGNHLAGKHILLVDDVITTGSTLEAAGHILMKIPDIRISVCSIACALH